MTVRAAPRSRPKQRWCDTINSDLRWLYLDGADAEDRVRWRSLVGWYVIRWC